jgi:hypothetical protein
MPTHHTLNHRCIVNWAKDGALAVMNDADLGGRDALKPDQIVAGRAGNGDHPRRPTRAPSIRLAPQPAGRGGMLAREVKVAEVVDRGDGGPRDDRWQAVGRHEQHVRRP